MDVGGGFWWWERRGWNRLVRRWCRVCRAGRKSSGRPDEEGGRKDRMRWKRESWREKPALRVLLVVFVGCVD